jgi:hypothetical protein
MVRSIQDQRRGTHHQDISVDQHSSRSESDQIKGRWNWDRIYGQTSEPSIGNVMIPGIGNGLMRTVPSWCTRKEQYSSDLNRWLVLKITHSSPTNAWRHKISKVSDKCDLCKVFYRGTIHEWKPVTRGTRMQHPSACMVTEAGINANGRRHESWLGIRKRVEHGFVLIFRHQWQDGIVELCSTTVHDRWRRHTLYKVFLEPVRTKVPFPWQSAGFLHLWHGVDSHPTPRWGSGGLELVWSCLLIGLFLNEGLVQLWVALVSQ